VRFGMADGIDNDAHFGTWTNNNIVAFTNGSERARFDSSGRLGLGTSSPGRKLTVTGDVSGDANNLLIVNENDTDGDSASIGFSMLSNDSFVKAGIFFKRTATQGRGDLIFATNDEVNGNNVTLSNARMTINRSGNVGISTDSPDGKLDVAGNVYLANYPGTGENQTILAQNDFGQMRAGIRSGIPYIGSITSLDFALYTGNTERARITSAGALLVGKTSQGLSTDGIELSTTLLRVTRNNNHPVELNRKGTDGAIINFYKDTSNVGVIGTQNWGIGTSSPSSKLNILDSSGDTDFLIESGTASSVTGQSTISMISRNASSGTSPTSKIVSIFEDSHDSALAFHTSDAGTTAEKMRINSSGNSLFQGGINLQDSGTNKIWLTRAETILGGSDDDFVIYTETGLNQRFYTNGSERMRLDSSGNLGLGTASASSFNQVTTQGSAPVLVVGGGTASISIYSANDSVGSLSFADGTTTTEQYKGLIQYNHGTNDMSFYTDASERMRIASDGKVSIGTASATELLNLASSGSAGIEMAGNSTTLGSTSFFVGHGSSNIAYVYQRANESLIFGTNNTERARITSDGFVGIGTTSIPNPFSGAYSNILQVGTDSGNTRFAITGGSSSSCDLAFADSNNASVSDSYAGSISYKHATDDMRFATATSERMRITSGGEFAFGTTSNDVTGGAIYFDELGAINTYIKVGHKTGSTNGADFLACYYNNVQIGGVAQATTSTVAFNTSSDYRLKEDLQDFNALEIASKIKMYDFKWKADDSRSYGVMAHELEEVLPQAVTGEKDAEEMQSVDYSKLVPILLKSIQELKAEIDELKKNK
jgi:hypothetical protein